MIKFIVFDFDGVFTDGIIDFTKKNLVSYNVKDGLSLKLLRDNIVYGCISSFNFSSHDLYIKEHFEGSSSYSIIEPREIISSFSITFVPKIIKICF